MIKLLWNLSGKKGIMWINCYYIKRDNSENVPIKTNCTWILKAVLKQKSIINQLQLWPQLHQENRYHCKHTYLKILGEQHVVSWKNLVHNNLARPRAIFIVWLTCHNSLTTKDQLKFFHMLQEDNCCFYPKQETLSHLLFDCPTMCRI